MRFAAHLAQFGHAIYDLDFAKPVPADAPAPLVEMLKVYLAGEINPYERQRSALEFRRQGEETIVRRLDPLRRKWFLKLLKWAQGAAPLREDSIADLGLGYPLLRRMLAELGRRFVAGGVMANAEDVYWLEAHEVDRAVNALESAGMLSNLAEPVTARQARWQAMRQVTPPSSLPRMTWMARFVPDVDQKGNILKGYGASAGVVQARACVLTGPADFDQMRAGDVIVAGITTPAWTPLFVRASAIVTDIGGPLSHSSIVAREYGIPAVLGTGSATRRIKTGQIITVDGSVGKVILKEG
jgi:phosphohistidine swiveling domain-containing protein